MPHQKRRHSVGGDGEIYAFLPSNLGDYGGEHVHLGEDFQDAENAEDIFDGEQNERERRRGRGSRQHE